MFTVCATQLPSGSAAERFSHLLRLYVSAFPAQERADPAQLSAALSSGEKRLWTIEVERRHAGFAVCQVLDSDCWLLEYLAIEAADRSTGLGAQLLRQVRHDLRSVGATTLYLEVEPPDETDEESWMSRRLGWYRRQGATVAADAALYAMPNALTGEPLPMTLMAMPLRGGAAKRDFPVLCRDVTVIFGRSYGLSLESDLVQRVLKGLSC